MTERETRLRKFLNTVLNGQKPLAPSQRDLFIEALCAQVDVVGCLTLVSNSKNGIQAIQNALRFELSETFFNEGAVQIITYLQAPDVLTINSGKFLAQFLLAIVEPPVFWQPFCQAFEDQRLNFDAQKCFAWLLLQLILLVEMPESPYRTLAEDPKITELLTNSPDFELRTLGQKLKSVITIADDSKKDYHPGGRHDNDFADFRQISILPTGDEVTSQEFPFLRCRAELEDPENTDSRVAIYLDNQFRLLREDMLSEMKEELLIVRGEKKGSRRGLSVRGLQLVDIHCAPDGNRRDKWGLLLQLAEDLPQLQRLKGKGRLDFLKNHRKFLPHQSITCLFSDGNIIGFATLDRDEDLLSRTPPVLLLHPQGSDSIVKNLLAKLQSSTVLSLVQINTAIFAYEPILKAVQSMRQVPLDLEILFWNESSTPLSPSKMPSSIINSIQADPGRDLRPLLGTPKQICLDKSQSKSLLAGLTQRVALIQGPPGTGKSFIGALLAKVIHDHTKQNILVVCYTNHALDQFLEDLLDIGIPSDSMVRLGGKSTSRTEPMSLHNQTSTHKLGKSEFASLDNLRLSLKTTDDQLRRAFDLYKAAKVNANDILDYIEFEDPDYFEAFRLPKSEDGTVSIGKGGRAMKETYLLERWMRGQNAGAWMSTQHVRAAQAIWDTTPSVRSQRITQWQDAILGERVSKVVELARSYDSTRDNIEDIYARKDVAILRSKRIIGCTTTAAAKYTSVIQSAAPHVLLVEEAGEILESHVLTALGAKKEQLILIGDHKQLRPKVNSYTLTVEKGEGYDLNMSLFERLVVKGYPHETLCEQHRMRPEVSRLVRELTYPDLVDAPSTKNRPDIRGLRDNIIFINHSRPEDDKSDITDRFATSSKQNAHEVDIVVKIIRYLAQQGYGTDSMVILTPYLGQLNNFFKRLKTDNDPILNDLDSFDLIRAGLLTQASAHISKKSIRLATIDNYQGEESDIVIISLTRSNPNNDIGFMFSPERLNVLLSRARNGLIMVGNATTFTHSRKGGELWLRLFNLLTSGGHVYDGLPVKCERHPSRVATLINPDDFDDLCPDGGCAEPCGTMLNCGLHSCPSKCHQIVDHSKMQCNQIMFSQCNNGHDRSYECHKGPPANCKKCEQDAKRKDQKLRREFALKQKREAEQLAHAKRVTEIEDQIAQERQKLRDKQLAEEREEIVRQKQKELEETTTLVISGNTPSNVDKRGANPIQGSSKSTDYPMASGSGLVTPEVAQGPKEGNVKSTDPPELSSTAPPKESASEKEWTRRKTMEGAMNDAIDGLMEMTGLEEVKAQVLRIKDKIDLAQRQNVSSKAERFHVVLQGNPGTGKTTVARLYAKFLTSVGVLPGNKFIETTGSRLASDGVDGVKKHIGGLVNDGGGTMFIDEAYQLTSSHNYQGGQVLDFLLAEMENNVGKIVFLFAGYRKEMEKFFEHNPGLPSRVPYSMSFEDYTDDELLLMLERMIQKHWAGCMQVEGGTMGLYCRIAARRLGCGRGREGFGNARALSNVFERMRERQADRVQRAKRQGQQANDFELQGVDIIGPDPATVLRESPAYTKLMKLIGLGAVKDSINSLFELIKTNYSRELSERKPIEISLNRVFLGSPGTGKTTVAKLYGEILANMGLLSNGEVIVKNPADFVGSALGQSEANTKAVLASTIGKILVIDEAYMLYGGQGGIADPYKSAVIDTIVAEVQSVPGEDRCVLLLGYKEQMEEMFQNVNPGLARRFAIENAFHFEDFTDAELLEILNLKLKQQDLDATEEAKKVAIDVLSRARNRPNFGNGGEVENLLSLAKARYQSRARQHGAVDIIFQPEDFDPDFDRNSKAASNLQELFKDIVGSEQIVTRLGDYQRMAVSIKARNLDPRALIPTSFIFKGPPGTGKTTVARKMGQVYYDMGFLSSPEVVECSASDLVGEYVGQTGPKTKKLFEKVLGRVLFIDEAYRLGEGHFAQEAMDELVGILTQERFKGKIIVILAGYDAEMDRLMGVNPGLASRFPESIFFADLNAESALKILDADLVKSSIRLPDLGDTSSAGYKHMSDLIEDLASLPSWGNARDMKTLAKKMIQKALVSQAVMGASGTEMILPLSDAISIMEQTLAERQKQDVNIQSKQKAFLPQGPIQTLNAQPPPKHNVKTSHNIETTKSGKKPATPPPKEEEGESDERDPGVSDEVWRQLQLAKDETARVEREAQEAIKRMEKAWLEAKKREERAQREQEKLKRAEQQAKEDAKRKELQKKLEQERLKALRAKQEKERKQRELEEKRQAEQKRQEEERKAKEKLRAMGVCPAGYHWYRQGGGWRCGGGSHYVTDGQLGM